MVFWGHFLKALSYWACKAHSQPSGENIRDYSVYEQFTFITVWCKYIHYFISKYNEVQWKLTIIWGGGFHSTVTKERKDNGKHCVTNVTIIMFEKTLRQSSRAKNIKVSEFLTKHTSNSPIMFVTLKCFAVLFWNSLILQLSAGCNKCLNYP